jgi:hypothetical protein
MTKHDARGTEMKSVEFCYWLQGLFELGDPKRLDEKQTDLIKRHLALVFVHEIDQSYPKDQQQKLNAIHAAHDPFGGVDPTKPVMRC